MKYFGFDKRYSVAVPEDQQSIAALQSVNLSCVLRNDYLALVADFYNSEDVFSVFFLHNFV